MRDTYTATFRDDADGMAMMEQYSAFLRLQSEAGHLDDEEYLNRLDAILGDNMAAINGYPDGDPGVPDSGEIERMLALQDEDEEVRRNHGQRRILQFDEPVQDDAAYGFGPGMSDDGHDQISDASYAEGAEPEMPEDEGLETDPSLDVSYEGSPAAAAEAQGLETDPSLDIAYGDGESVDQEHAFDWPSDDVPDATPAAAHDEIDAAYPGQIEIHDKPSAGAGLEEAWAPPDPAPAAAAPADGHIEVTEEFEINDWLDTLAAGTGLLSGVQTAEYVPEDEPASPNVAAPAYEKTAAMKQMDLMVAQKFPEPEYDGPELTGP